MDDFRKSFVWLVLAIMTAQFSFSQVVSAAGSTIVLNEIAWSGSLDSANDEWIELYNYGSSEVDLSGWTLEDDGEVVVTFNELTIPAYGYFLIEDSEDATSVKGDLVTGLSFANTGDEIVLKNENGEIVDSVDQWFAGGDDEKASMERIDPEADDWGNALSGNSAKSSGGSDILGTPGSINSIYAGSGSLISIEGSGPDFSIEVQEANDLFAYGMDIVYDPSILNFVSAEEGSFLKNDGSETSFFAGLENGEEGKVVVAAARLSQPESGVSGNGELFNLNFEIIGTGASELMFAGSSFIVDINGDIPAQFVGGSFGSDGDGSGDGGGGDLPPDGGESPDAVTGLNIQLGASRYSFELDWDAGEADHYLIMRKQFDGSYIQIGQTTETSFVDALSILPFVNYEYKIIAVKAGISAEAASIEIQETRALSGDNDRSDRVDGRDLEKLARSYTASFGDEKYDPLVDTTFDGVIDGSDLIDIGANFGLTYTFE